MPRRAPVIDVEVKDLDILRTRAKSRTLPKHIVDRARIVLYCAEGMSVTEIAQKVGTYPNKVIFWRERYAGDGIKGLSDHRRSGRKTIYGANLRKRILDTVSQPPPPGYGKWDGRLVAKELGVNVHKVWAILREATVHLQRQRSWCISTDPNFTAKAADIVGLYLDPPENAMVLCVDEKPNIQALERKTGYIETHDGKVMRAYKSTYKRHGVLNLFAALEVATGQVHGRTTKRKKKEDFLSFMSKIVEEYEPEPEIHVIVDNYSTHKRNDEWLASHPSVSFHFTPTSASWLNQVEIFFSILTRKSLKGASFTTTEQLASHLSKFIESYNDTSQPFKWRKREVVGSQLKDTIGNLSN